MLDHNEWYFNDVRSLSPHLAKIHDGKEIYVFRRKHAVYGAMWIDVLASNTNDAKKIIGDISGIEWRLYESTSVPWTLRESYNGKDIYVFQNEHAIHGPISITILASSEQEARGIIDELTK